MRNRGMQTAPGAVVVQDDGMSRHTLLYVATAASTVIVAITLAVAVWRVATGIMWALIVIAVGNAVQMILIGAGMFCRQKAMGQADVIRAKADLAGVRRGKR